MSFIIDAPAVNAAFATSTLKVSILIGTFIFSESFFITGIARSICSAVLTETEPGLVDSAPMSMLYSP